MTGEKEHPERPLERIDLERPHAARIYNYLLGGTTNWAIDRAFGKEVIEGFPLLTSIAKANYDFLTQAVHYCARNGITQFLDIGSGIPMSGSVHEVAEKVDPTSSCVYVELEPIAVTRFQMFLEKHGDPDRHAVINADLLQVDQVWKAALRTGVLNPRKPICLVMGAVLHFLPKNSSVTSVMDQYRELLPPGSHLVISHVTDDDVAEPEASQLRNTIEHYKNSSTPLYLRNRQEIREFFGNYELIEPGLTWLPEWLRNKKYTKETAALLSQPRKSCVLGGVGRKN